MLFYKSVLGFEAEPVHELVDPYGLIQSRVLESRDRSVRLPLNASASPRTATSRFLVELWRRRACITSRSRRDDIFATMAAMRASNVPLLDIPDDLLRRPVDDARSRAGRDRAMRGLVNPVRPLGTGEFFHAYTQGVRRALLLRDRAAARL